MMHCFPGVSVDYFQDFFLPNFYPEGKFLGPVWVLAEQLLSGSDLVLRVQVSCLSEKPGSVF